MRIDGDLDFEATYFLRVTTFLGRTGEYRVSLRGPIDDHSNSTEGATRLSDRSLPGVIERPGDLDVFAFDVRDPGVYRLRSTGDTDTHCTLLDPEGAVIVSDDDGGQGSNCEVSETLEGAGTYYLRVRHFSRFRVGAYAVERIVGAAPPVEDDYGDTPETAGRIRAGEEVGAELEEQGDIDHFLFVPNQTGMWRAETLGDLDTTCVLLTDVGERLDDDDDSGMGMNCQIDFSLVAGRGYIFVVRGFVDREQGMYTVRTTSIPQE